MPESDNRAELAKLLRLLRVGTGMALTKAAGEAGIAAGTFYRMERGDPRTLYRPADVFYLRSHRGTGEIGVAVG